MPYNLVRLSDTLHMSCDNHCPWRSARLQQRLSAQLAGYKQVYEQLQTDFKAQNVQVSMPGARSVQVSYMVTQAPA